MNPTYFLFALLISFIACSPAPEEAVAKDDSGIKFLLINSTGHTLPPNSTLDDCGDGINVIFELSSELQSIEKTMIADHLDLTSLEIEKGRLLQVRVLDENRNVLAESTTTFNDILPRAGMQDFHLVNFCKDGIKFNF